jgi:hypothetical protein
MASISHFAFFILQLTGDAPRKASAICTAITGVRAWAKVPFQSSNNRNNTGKIMAATPGVLIGAKPQGAGYSINDAGFV